MYPDLVGSPSERPCFHPKRSRQALDQLKVSLGEIAPRSDRGETRAFSAARCFAEVIFDAPLALRDTTRTQTQRLVGLPGEMVFKCSCHPCVCFFALSKKHHPARVAIQ